MLVVLASLIFAHHWLVSNNALIEATAYKQTEKCLSARFSTLSGNNSMVRHSLNTLSHDFQQVTETTSLNQAVPYTLLNILNILNINQY